MEFVLLSEKHVKQIADLEKQYFSAPWSEKSIAEEIKNSLSLWVVAVDEDTVVGYVGSQTVLFEADMMNLAVDRSYRRQGIARKLVSFLIDRRRENKTYSLTLEVCASNVAAISLYHELGFKEVGRRPRYYSKPVEDALILRKEWEV